MSAFKGAVQVGSNAVEADLALSKDGVVVISHVCLGINITGWRHGANGLMGDDRINRLSAASGWIKISLTVTGSI